MAALDDHAPALTEASGPVSARPLAEGLAAIVAAPTPAEIEARAADLREEVGDDPGLCLVIETVAAEALRQVGERTRVAADERRARRLLQSSADVVYTLDLDGRYTWISDAIEPLTGYTPDEVLGRHYSFFAPPGSVERIDEIFRSKLDGEAETTRYEWVYVAKDGSHVDVEIHSRRLVEDGRPVGVHGIIRDIRDRLAAERRVRETEARYRLLAEQLPLVMYVDRLEESWPSEFMSAHVAEMLGYAPEEWYDDPGLFEKVVHPDDRHVALHVPDSVDPQAVVTDEYRLVGKDGRIVWVQDTAVPVVEADGSIRRMQGFLVDTTERKRTELLLDAQLALLGLLPQEARARDLEALVRGQLAGILDGIDAEVVLDRDAPRADGVAVPVVGADGAAAGAIVLEPDHGRTLTPAELQAVEVLARTVGVVLDRIRAEDAKARLLADLTGVVEASPIAIVSLDLEGRVITWNAAAERLFGWRADEVLGRPTPTIEGVEDGSRGLHLAINEGRTLIEEPLVRRHRDGRAIEVSASTSLLHDEAGAVCGVLALFTDLGEKHRQERHLREAEERYRTLAEKLPLVTYVDAVEPGEPLRYISPQVEVMLGYTAETWLADASNFWRSVLHPDDRDRVVEELRQAHANDGVRSTDYRMIHADGRVVWIHDECRPVVDANGERLYLQGYILDVTAERRASDLVRAQLRVLEMIATGSPLRQVLDAVSSSLEELVPEIRSSILLLGADDRLRHGAAPSMPGTWRDGVDGLEIGEGRGSCGVAASRGELVVTEDVLADPAWSEYRGLAGAHGVRSCWSMPIFSSGGSVLGTFAVYGAEARRPSADELELGGILAQLAGIAIEKQRSEDAVVDTTASLDRLIDDAPLPIVVIDLAGNVSEWNRAAERVFGWSRDEVIGRPPPHASAQAADSYAALRARALAGESLSGIETTRLRKDGTLLDVSLSLAPLIRNGAVVGVVAVLADTTAERRARDELLSAEARYRALVEQMPVATYVSAVDDVGLKYMSPQSVQLLGYDVEEWNGDPELVHKVVHPDDLERAISVSRRARLTGEPQQVEFRARRKDGGEVWLLDRMVRITDSEGRPVVVQGFLMDVTDRKRAEEEVGRLGGHVELLLNSAGEGIFALDAKGRVTLVNPAAARMLGWEAEELIGEQIHRLIHHTRADGSRYPREECPTLAALDGETHHTEGEVFWRKDGESFPVEYTSTPIRQDDAIVGVAVVFRDVSAHRALEEQLRHAQKMEAVGRLAGGVAHDFNNLLTAITGYVELARHRLGGGDSALSHDLDEVGKAATRAASLTRQLLAFSRRQVMQPRVIDVNGVVTDMEKMLRRLIGEDVELTVELDEGIGAVRVDPGQLEQVVLNLAVNARDAMPGGGRLTIRTEAVGRNDPSLHPVVAGREGDLVALTVSDTGYGMEAETLERVFEPFFTTKQVGEGTGLGLSTAYGIVKQSGGELVATSEPGRGSTFFVYLPIAEETAPADPVGPERGSLPLGSETLLLVEDEDVVRRLVSEVLKSRGYHVLEARNGFEALEVCADEDLSIDLLLTDVVMPGMSGRELAETLAPMRPVMRVLYMSGYTDDALVSHGVAQGPAFIQKPFSMDTLASKVRELLDVAIVERSLRAG